MMIRKKAPTSTTRYSIDPITAIQMATINVAQHLRMSRDFGSISPGRIADIVILDDLDLVLADKVLVHGKLVAEKGELIEQPPSFAYPRWAKETIHIKRKVIADDLAVRVDNGASEAKARVLIADIPKKAVIETLRVSDGIVLPDEGKDILSMAVLERHTGSGNSGTTFIKGTGIKNGALAGSVSHDAHNIWTIGTDHEYMALAVNELVNMRGGFAVVKNGEVIARMELPIGGLISEEPVEVVAKKFEEIEQVALKKELHCSMEGLPLFTLSVMSLPNIPEWGITDKGLIEVRTMALIDTVVE